MKTRFVVSTLTALLGMVAISASACQLHANGFGSFAAYHSNIMERDLAAMADNYPSVTLARRTAVKVGTENSRSVRIHVPLSYTNVTLSVTGGDGIELLSSSDLSLSAVSKDYDLVFTTLSPGTHKITVNLNATYEGAAFSTEHTMIVEAG